VRPGKAIAKHDLKHAKTVDHCDGHLEIGRSTSLQRRLSEIKGKLRAQRLVSNQTVFLSMSG
jgi:hypothetical protein